MYVAISSLVKNIISLYICSIGDINKEFFSYSFWLEELNKVLMSA